MNLKKWTMCFYPYTHNLEIVLCFFLFQFAWICLVSFHIVSPNYLSQYLISPYTTYFQTVISIVLKAHSGPQKNTKWISKGLDVASFCFVALGSVQITDSIKRKLHSWNIKLLSLNVFPIFWAFRSKWW